jgi:hypothetical protein
MPDEPQTPPSNGATSPEPKSLRDIAEDAYDTVLDSAEADVGQDAAIGQDGQPRDNLGRFVAKDRDEPGEAAEAKQPPPSPESQTAQPETATQPREGEAAAAPANWSAADREAFSKLPPEGQQFLLRRHSEMEGDYQRRVQATAQADSFVRNLAPIFTDPVIAGSIREAGWAPTDAIREWAALHRRALSPNLNDRIAMVQEIAQRCGVDPAAVAPSRSGGPGQLSEADLADPAIRYFADHVGQTSNRVQALEGLIQQMQQANAQAAQAEALKVTRWGIDSFAEEKGPDGKLLRPDFDTVLPQIIELFQANPGRDLREAYEAARWWNPVTREQLLQQTRHGVERQQSDQRARQAVRSNARGLTSPVTKPGEPAGGKNLRDVLESTADEVGF